MSTGCPGPGPGQHAGPRAGVSRRPPALLLGPCDTMGLGPGRSQVATGLGWADDTQSGLGRPHPTHRRAWEPVQPLFQSSFLRCAWEDLVGPRLRFGPSFGCCRHVGSDGHPEVGIRPLSTPREAGFSSVVRVALLELVLAQCPPGTLGLGPGHLRVSAIPCASAHPSPRFAQRRQ